jgi:hypothetical protein
MAPPPSFHFLSNQLVRLARLIRQGSWKVCLSSLVVLASLGNSRAEKLKKPQDVFPTGETLVYEVRWDPPAWMFFFPTVTAGELTLRVWEAANTQQDSTLRVTAEAISSGFLPRIAGISVRDHFESIIATPEFCSLQMTKLLREGKRQRDIVLTFHPESGTGHYLSLDVSRTPHVELKNEEVKNVPSCVQDLISAIYHTRLRELKVGEEHALTVSDDGKVKPIRLRVSRREEVHVEAHSYSALKLETMAVFGGLFKEGGTLSVWVTDDVRCVPVKFEAKVKLGKVFGSIKRMG